MDRRSNRATALDRHPQGRDGEVGGHPVGDGIAHDPVGEHVLDRAAIQLALTGPMLGDVGEPELVGRRGGEDPLHQIVVHRGAGLAALAAPAPTDRADDPVGRAHPPHAPLRRDEPEVGEVVSDQSIPERRLFGMQIERRVRQLRLIPSSVRDRVAQPPVIRLLRDLQHPARHRDRHPHWGAGRSQLADERVDHFGSDP